MDEIVSAVAAVVIVDTEISRLAPSPLIDASFIVVKRERKEENANAPKVVKIEDRLAPPDQGYYQSICLDPSVGERLTLSIVNLKMFCSVLIDQ